MNWVKLGRVALRLVGTAVGLTESSQTTLKNGDKLNMALGMVNSLATDCQELSPAQLAILAKPEVQEALKAYATARVGLENAIAKASETA